jgi:hypothetical protein
MHDGSFQGPKQCVRGTSAAHQQPWQWLLRSVVVVDGINITYEGPGSGSTEGSASFKAFAVKVSGPSSSSYGLTIGNCQFSQSDVGVELFAALNWGIEGNTFDNTP